MIFFHPKLKSTRFFIHLSGSLRRRINPFEKKGKKRRLNPKSRSVSMSEITMKELLESGVHFGHQTKRWNPKMKKYIFGERNQIYIIDLQQTVKLFHHAYDFVKNTVAAGQSILFVGTKRQAESIIREEATRCGMFFISHRWLGGMLTNFQTIRKSIDKLKKLEAMKLDGTFDKLTKKEVSRLEKE